MGRAPCCDKVGLKRGPWTPQEDQVLVSFIQQHGHSNWRALPKQAGLLRCGKSCRLRWINYLRPDIKRGNFSKEEEDTIIQLHEMMGNRWSAIAARLPGRTDNEIKNVWHTHLKKRLENQQSQHQTTKSKVVKKHNHESTTASNSTMSTNSSFPETSAGTNNTDVHNPNSSQRSYSSDDFSSLTDVSSVETPMNNNSSNNNNNNSSSNSMGVSVNVDDQEFEDYFPIIDETFWSTDELTYEDINMDNVFSNISEDDQVLIHQIERSSYQQQEENSSSMYIVDHTHNNGPLHQTDSMDFWLDVFVRAGGAPELPEF